MHYVRVHNTSSHGQEFEVHGANGNKNINVAPGATSSIEAPDKAQIALIALHEGHEGEQAEITKDGYGGNDFYDISCIVGAGGNLTIEQIGDPSTRRGDATFMQNCNDAYHRASQAVKDSLRGQVFLDSKGNVQRLAAPKNSEALEKFVRTFAEGKVYIGVGAWNGSKGDAGDNACV